jgi:hypothetical protein
MDYKKYFEQKGKSLIFTGDVLEILIPSRYSNHGYLDIGNSIHTIGIFDMTINETIKTGYLLAATIEILPSETDMVSINNEKYLKLILHKGDTFIKDCNIVNDSKISYVMFYEIFYTGHFPEFLKYQDYAFLFDKFGMATGDKFGTDHMIFEMIVSVLFRDKNNVSMLYRNTPMTKEPLSIPLRLISHVAQSTTAKMIGSYMKDGIDASLVNAGDKFNSDVEDILRR